MRAFLLVLISVFGVSAFAAGHAASAATVAAKADGTIKFDYRKGEDLTKVIDDYARASGQKFIVDPILRGRITIMNPGPVSLNEAFNQLSLALAANGMGISTQGDVMYITQARAIQRNLIPVVAEPPPIEPERMVTWIATLKYVSADEVNKQLRILTSKDGELVPVTHSNQLIISDWSSNLNRVAQILAQIDRPAPKH